MLTKSDKTRQDLMDAALVALREDGYPGVTVAKIAARAGRAHGTFYVYFENKEDIFVHLVRSAWGKLKQESREVWDNAAPRNSIYRSILRYLDGHAREVDLVRVVDHLAPINETFHALKVDVHHDFVRIIVRGITLMGDQAQLGQLDAEVVGELLACMLGDFSRNYAFERDRVAAARKITEVWCRVIGYVGSV